jgi:hypothetical protein
MATGGASNEATTTVGMPQTGLILPAALSSNPPGRSSPTVAGLSRGRQPTEALISSLPGSVTHRLAVEVYLCVIATLARVRVQNARAGCRVRRVGMWRQS